MRLDWLRPVCASQGPFATVVVDVSHDTEDAGHLAELRRRAVRDQLSERGAPETVLEKIDTALADADPAVGEAGRALVVDERDILVDVPLASPPRADHVVWASVPDLLPVVNAVPEEVPTVVVRVDEEGGELLAPGAEAPQPVVGRTKPVHKVRGGAWSHRRMQARVEETWRHNATEVAARVDERVRADDARLLVIAGDPRSRARLRDALPERAASVATEVPHSGGTDPAELSGAVAGAVDLLLDDDRRTAFARLVELLRKPEGRAVSGLAAVLAAAQAQAMETLFIDPACVTDATAWVGPEPAQLAATSAELGVLGVDAAQEAPAVAALVRAAVCADASLVVLDDPDLVLGRDRLDEPSAVPESAVLGGDVLADGLGAVLRFPIS